MATVRGRKCMALSEELLRQRARAADDDLLAGEDAVLHGNERTHPALVEVDREALESALAFGLADLQEHHFVLAHPDHRRPRNGHGLSLVYGNPDGRVHHGPEL